MNSIYLSCTIINFANDLRVARPIGRAHLAYRVRAFQSRAARQPELPECSHLN